ncbi:MAG TPA: AMP-binding protein, partial [Opitutaceae bacterium]
MPRWVEVPAALLARLLYRVRVLGASHVPASGGAVLISNHLSYVDAILLQLACPRPLRFMAFRGPGTNAVLRWVFARAGVIEIAPGRPLHAMRSAVLALGRGEIVCVFPEGGISRTGQLMRIRAGFELLARRARVPVLPASVDGMWGSVFSFSGNRYLWKAPRLLPTPVCVAFGAPIEPGLAKPEAARKSLLELGVLAFSQRPALSRHLGREVVRSLARRPGRLALVDRTAGRRLLSAGRLLAASAALSRRLRATVPERRVGIVLPPGAGATIANLAVMCAGKVPVNLNFTAGRISAESSIAAAGIRTVLSAEAMRTRLADFPWPERTVDLREELLACGRPAMAAWLAAAWLLPNQWVAGLIGLPRKGDGDEAAVLFTSGSAGSPRGVVLSHRNLLANCEQISSLSIFPRSATMLGCLPVFHSFGFTFTMWYPLLRGCLLVTTPSPLDTRAIIDSVREEAVTVLIGAPTFLRPLLRRAEPADLRSLELVVTGAEKLNDDLRLGFLEKFHIAILQGYGLTETSPVSNVNQPHPAVTTGTADEQLGNKVGTVGRLLPGMAARVVDPESGDELAQGETGILCLKGPNVFSNYLGEEAAGGPSFRGGWFVTWDLARVDEDGFVSVEGRLARFSKIGGEMVPHGTVEAKIAEVFGVDPGDAQSVVVVGVPDAAKGESLVALSTIDLSAEEVRRRLSAAGF